MQNHLPYAMPLVRVPIVCYYYHYIIIYEHVCVLFVCYKYALKLSMQLPWLASVRPARCPPTPHRKSNQNLVFHFVVVIIRGIVVSTATKWEQAFVIDIKVS